MISAAGCKSDFQRNNYTILNPFCALDDVERLKDNPDDYVVHFAYDFQQMKDEYCK